MSQKGEALLHLANGLYMGPIDSTFVSLEELGGVHVGAGLEDEE